MNPNEIEIIQKLSAAAAEPKAEFAQSLHERLLQRERILKTNQIPPRRRHVMNYKKLIVGFAGVAALAGITAFVIANNSKDGDVRQTAQNNSSNSSVSQTSSLPSQQAQNLEEARQLLTFEPLLPSKQINGESLTDIKVGTKNGMFDDSDTLYLTFADNQGTLFKTSQSTKKFNYPTDVEKVNLQIYGKPVVAYFHKLPELEDGSGPNSAGSDVASPSSFMFWTSDGVNYEISEFGRLTKQQLIELANSLR